VSRLKGAESVDGFVHGGLVITAQSKLDRCTCKSNWFRSGGMGPSPVYGQRTGMNKTSMGSLVANLLEVLAQLGDRVEGVGGLDVSRVVSDEERLGRLVGDNTLLALWVGQQVVWGEDAIYMATWGGDAPSWP
jgi:hypothetical protein